jgi:hypothetical protein
VPATLRVTHELDFGIELRRGQFDVVLDGSTVGSVERHDTLDTPLEPGPHTIRMRKGRYSSREQSFDAADGQAVNFQCHGCRIWPLWLASFVVPTLAIALKRE